MILEGILALAQGEHPRLIAERLNGFLPQNANPDLKLPGTTGQQELSRRPRSRSKPHATPSVRSH